MNELTFESKRPSVSGELQGFLQWLKLMPIAAYAVDRRGQVVGWNDRAVEIWGSAPGNQKNCQVCQVIECPMRKVASSGVGVKLHEVGYVRGDGSRRLLNFNIEPIRGADGSVLGAINCFEDITDRKEGEERLRLLTDLIPQLTWSNDPEGNIIFRNRKWREYTGLEVLGPGNSAMGLIHDDDREEARKSWARSLATGAEFLCEHRFRRADGEYRWHLSRAVPVRDKDGHIVQWFGSSTDIHEQKMVEEAHKRSEERYRALAELSPQMIWLGDPLGRIGFANKSFLDFLGMENLEEYRVSWMESLYPEDLEKVKKAREAAIGMHREYEIEVRFKRAADGAYRWFLLRGLPLRDFHGRLEKWMGVAIDIHERKLAETELKRAKEAAESASQLKSAFLANMSHEIRTPLGAMLGFTDLLKDGELSADERSSYLSIIQRNGEQLSTIINDILDLSKVESGHLQVERIPSDVSEIVGDVTSLLEVKAKDKGLVLRSSFEEGLPSRLMIDPGRLKQILVNMLGNAIKFTKFGSVDLKVSYLEPALEISIADTGIGIDAERAEGLFKPFMQADESMTRRFGGTGLGLALSRKLAQAMGGDVVLKDTTIGSGAVFSISLVAEPAEAPVSKAHPRPSDIPAGAVCAEASAGQLALDKMKILLVDDSPDNRMFVSRMLQKRGATVETAVNGLEGVQRALQEEFDLILMDLQMPVLDGYSATERLRESGYQKPIIALTAHAMTEVRKKCLGIGCTDHLAKPVQVDKLVEALVRCRT